MLTSSEEIQVDGSTKNICGATTMQAVRFFKEVIGGQHMENFYVII